VDLLVDEGIATITIDNVRRANALTKPMLDQLRNHLQAVSHAPNVAAVVLRGAGDNFSAGLDISCISTRPTDRIEDAFADVERLLAQCPRPVVAAIRGHCIGGGAQLAAACDIRVAAEGSQFAITPAKLGLIYPSSSIERLVRTIGPAVTKRLIFTADTIDGPTALRYGFVTDLVSADSFEATVRSLAATIAARAPSTLRAAKEMAGEATRHGQVSDDLRNTWRTAPNPDLAIGLSAFAQKRPPVFRRRTTSAVPPAPSRPLP
jgi:enoyl-CoA hydratase/carnithine racemase